jgi:hypothetical protein
MQSNKTDDSNTKTQSFQEVCDTIEPNSTTCGKEKQRFYVALVRKLQRRIRTIDTREDITL